MPATFAKLIAPESDNRPREIALAEFPVRVGRRKENGICLEDRWVSRDHCELVRQAESLVVRDLGSRHGTFVNGRPIHEATLNPGDELSVGLTRFVVHYAGEAAAVPNLQPATV